MRCHCILVTSDSDQGSWEGVKCAYNVCNGLFNLQEWLDLLSALRSQKKGRSERRCGSVHKTEPVLAV